MKLALSHYEKISLLSGFLITFVFGSLYTLGTITPYIASYIHYENDPTIYAVDVSILYPTYMVSQVVGIVLSMYLSSLMIKGPFCRNGLGLRLCVLLGFMEWLFVLLWLLFSNLTLPMCSFMEVCMVFWSDLATSFICSIAMHIY